jgi:hypothetical protein
VDILDNAYNGQTRCLALHVCIEDSEQASNNRHDGLIECQFPRIRGNVDIWNNLFDDSIPIAIKSCCIPGNNFALLINARVCKWRLSQTELFDSFQVKNLKT